MVLPRPPPPGLSATSAKMRAGLVESSVPLASEGSCSAEARVATLLQRVGGYALLPALKGLMAAASGDAAWLRVRAPLIPLDAAQAESMAELARELHLDLTAD